MRKFDFKGVSFGASEDDVDENICEGLGPGSLVVEPDHENRECEEGEAENHEEDPEFFENCVDHSDESGEGVENSEEREEAVV